jgi:hypothetical protein
MLRPYGWLFKEGVGKLGDILDLSEIRYSNSNLKKFPQCPELVEE